MTDDFLELDKQALPKIRNRIILDYLEYRQRLQRALDSSIISRKEYVRRKQRLEFYDMLFGIAGGDDDANLDNIVQELLSLIKPED